MLTKVNLPKKNSPREKLFFLVFKQGLILPKMIITKYYIYLYYFRPILSLIYKLR